MWLFISISATAAAFMSAELTGIRYVAAKVPVDARLTLAVVAIAFWAGVIFLLGLCKTTVRSAFAEPAGRTAKLERGMPSITDLPLLLLSVYHRIVFVCALLLYIPSFTSNCLTRLNKNSFFSSFRRRCIIVELKNFYDLYEKKC